MAGRAAGEVPEGETAAAAGGGAGDNQMWFPDKQADGAFWIRNHKRVGLCLDVSGYGGSGSRGAHLTAFTCSARDDHLWSFA